MTENHKKLIRLYREVKIFAQKKHPLLVSSENDNLFEEIESFSKARLAFFKK